MSNRYEYLVSYQFQGGSGRGFVTMFAPVDRADRVVEVEKMLAENNGREHLPCLFATNIVLLREWSE